MKTSIRIILALLLLCSALGAQEYKIITGANVNYNMPVGGLAERFEAAAGGSFFIGAYTAGNWSWAGKLDYIKLTELNREKIYKSVEAEINGKKSIYEFDLPGLNMELTTIGLSAQSRYEVFSTGPFQTNLKAGFGFYYWEFSRNGFNDSLQVDTTGAGDMVTVASPEVPPIFQRDWSGTFNTGIELNMALFGPAMISVSAEYKLIVGELWPTLALDIENVSGLQFIDINAGVMIRM